MVSYDDEVYKQLIAAAASRDDEIGTIHRASDALKLIKTQRTVSHSQLSPRLQTEGKQRNELFADLDPEAERPQMRPSSFRVQCDQSSLPQTKFRRAHTHSAIHHSDSDGVITRTYRTFSAKPSE